ncbi:MAG: UDP-N-acetylmuramate dehydrogenase [Caldiserica bacterium]|jgi:UDP-N-acetylmuramate dehydrogenase|nr:UDP-N-acetylmuramate dehydrogenase [Caldisericota bacterium]
MVDSVIDRFRRRVEQRVLTKEPLSLYTSFHIGGPAEYLYTPCGEEDLICALRAARALKVPTTVLGNGTNVLVSDRGVEGLVVRLMETSLQPVMEKGLVLARAPMPLSSLLDFVIHQDLSGLEYLTSIPGTVGGAVYMNAGSFSQAISTHLAYVEVLDRNLEYVVKKHEEVDFDYRYSEFQESGAIILGAAFDLEAGDGATIRSTAARIRSEKHAKQSWEHPNAGSIFTNPPTTYAGKLIEEAGCKGLQVGQAQVSAKHANFIVNLGGATALDVAGLMDIVVQKVYARFNVRLSPEIRLLGDFS